MKKTRNGKRLHLIALILGVYAVFLGFGLVLASFGDMSGAVRAIRIIAGLGIAGFGFFGIWDGVRDLIRPPANSELKTITQYVLTDISGNRTSNITAEMIRDEMGKLQADTQDCFHLQLLTPYDIPERGALKQITCTMQPSLTLLAFFQTAEGGWKVCIRSIDPDAAADWFGRLLEDPAEVNWNDGWETQDAATSEAKDTEDTEDREFRIRVMRNQAGNYAVWHQRLVIVGKAWRNEHKFFTAHDVELAVQGVSDGKYQYARLEWGASSFDIIPGPEDQLQVIWCTNIIWSDKNRRFFRREGTVNQVKFWLIQYLYDGHIDGYWEEIDDPAKK